MANRKCKSLALLLGVINFLSHLAENGALAAPQGKKSSLTDLLEAQLAPLDSADRQVLSATLERVIKYSQDKEDDNDDLSIEDMTELYFGDDENETSLRGEFARLELACAKLLEAMDKIEELPNQAELFSHQATGVFMNKWLEPYRMCAAWRDDGDDRPEFNWDFN